MVPAAAPSGPSYGQHYYGGGAPPPPPQQQPPGLLPLAPVSYGPPPPPPPQQQLYPAYVPPHVSLPALPPALPAYTRSEATAAAPPRERAAPKRDKRKGLRQKLRKTKMCANFESGTCSFGADCAFAHSQEELQEVPDLKKASTCQAEPQNGRGKAGAASGSADGKQEEEGGKKPTEGAVSAGSVGHPYNCQPPCKYYWKKRGCKDGDKCVRCHLCPWTKDAGGKKRKRPAADDEEKEEGDASSDDDAIVPLCEKRRRTGSPEAGRIDESKLDMFGNSQPSWLRGLDAQRGSSSSTHSGYIAAASGYAPAWSQWPPMYPQPFDPRR